MVAFLDRLMAVLAALGGAERKLRPRNRIALGIWWAALLILVYLFSGHASKFIYVDF
jgi:hypothetical protein